MIFTSEELACRSCTWRRADWPSPRGERLTSLSGGAALLTTASLFLPSAAARDFVSTVRRLLVSFALPSVVVATDPGREG